MLQAEITKTEEVTDEELQMITRLYKNFNHQNRNLMLLTSNLLYASQQNNEPDQKAG